MRINLNDLRRHYASLPDEALLDLDRNELSDVAKPLFDEELARRELSLDEDVGSAQSLKPPDQPGGDGEYGFQDGPEPEWLEDAACACAFAVRSRTSDESTAERSREALRAAGIPCHINMVQEDPPHFDPSPQYSLRVLVPGPLVLHAMSVLDRDILNDVQEAEWRGHLEGLSDDELRALNPDIFCAGYLDRVTRLKRAFAEELDRRKLKVRT